MDAANVLESLGDFREFLVDRRGASDRTIKAYAADVRSFARFLVFQAKLANAAPAQTESDLPRLFVSWLRHQKKNAPTTMRRKLVALTIYFRWRVERGRSEVSPFESDKMVVRVPKPLPRALSRSDAMMLLGSRHCKKSLPPDAETNVVLRLLLATGIRVGEMCAIDASHVTSDGSAIRINGKGDRERVVFVGNGALQQSLANLAAARIAAQGSSGPLFLNRRSQRLTPQAFRLRLHQLAAASGISTRVTPHRLRHTAATLLIEEGVDIRFVQKLLGHASIATTEIYTKVADASLQAALARADPLGSMQPKQ